MLLVIKENISNFSYVSDTLKNDKNFILKTLKINPDIFEFLNEELKNDKDNS